MPTPTQAFAAVANALADVDPQDVEAVAGFYRRQFVSYPSPIRALISDFLIGLTDMPSASALDALKQTVALPVESIPSIEAPTWDQQYGDAMDYVAVEGERQAGG